MKILEGDKDRLVQVQRTRRGLCARCGESVAAHVNGSCLDGSGSFTWAHTREEMNQLIKNLEDALARAKGN